MKILVLNGPNLNLLGYKGLEADGEMTLTQMDKALATYGVEKYEGLELVFYQTNHEGQIIDMVQKASAQYEGLILNPSALCHYSYVLQDAVYASDIPVVEVHLINLGEQQEHRRHSLIGEVSEAQFMGEGLGSYEKALDYLMEHHKDS